MPATEIASQLVALDAVDLAACDSEELAGHSATAHRVVGYAESILAKIAVAADRLAEAGRAGDGADVLRNEGRSSAREAGRRARRAKALDEMPPLADALARGEIGCGHADAAARAAGDVDRDKKAEFTTKASELAEQAKTSTVEQFSRHCKALVDEINGDDGETELERQRRTTALRKGVNPETGMYWINGEFDPVTGNRLFGAIDAETDRLGRAQNPGAAGAPVGSNARLAARALADLVARGHCHAGEGTSRVPADLHVIIDVETLATDAHGDSVCELGDGTPIPVATARRIACEANVVPIMLGGDGVALDVGRTRRLATAAQRAALRAMYITCGFAGCNRPFDWCDIHHIVEWEAGGSTDLDNLLPLCSKHHHLVHAGRWRLELSSDRTLTITRPDGGHHATVELPSRQSARSRTQRRDRHRRPTPTPTP